MGESVEKRATQRIAMEIPIQLEKGSGMTRDVSVSGIYFVTEEPIEAGTRIRFTMEFEYVVPGRPVHLDCNAQVLRVEQHNGQRGIAARIDGTRNVDDFGTGCPGFSQGTNRLQ